MALLLFLASPLISAAEYDPVQVLQRVTQTVRASVRDIPNYTCVQTVNRDYFGPVASTLPRACDVLLEQRRRPTLDLVLRPYSTDRLRLDVTMIDRGEIFSWSGASRFEDSDIDHLVHTGPISTGSFGAFLAAVFETDVKKFSFERTIPAGDGTLLEYSFQVPKTDSHYKMKADKSFVAVAYTGTFTVDPETAELISMTITTGDLPLATQACQTTTTMDFTRVRMGEGKFLLPKQARQRFIYPNAEEVQNTTGFTNCREFRGNSTVSFFPDALPMTEAAKRTSTQLPSLPRGLRFSLVLTTAIPTGAAAAGDPFSAKLADALRDAKGKLLAPKGALVEGRLMRVQCFHRPPESIIVLKPEKLWVRGAAVPLSAVRDWTAVLTNRARQGKKGIEILMPLRGEDNSGVFRFSGDPFTVPAGFRSEWRTVTSSTTDALAPNLLPNPRPL